MARNEPLCDASHLPSGTVRLSRERIDRQLVRLGLSHEKVAQIAGIARNTFGAAYNGAPILRDTAKRIAVALEVTVEDLLDGSAASINGAEPPPKLIAGEWRVEQPLGNWIAASNGLQFRLYRVSHHYVAGRQGRAKCYDLLHLSNAAREALREQLLRHPMICERVGPHPHITENLGTQPGDEAQQWWVIDRWIDGMPLSGRLEPKRIQSDGPIQGPGLARLMTEIALGLAALHAKGVVFRELAPSRVHLHQADGRVILTEFELAKLLGAAPTVSREWPDDLYRAPEVAGGKTSEQSDFYSWARILVHAVTGREPSEESPTARELGSLPKGIWRLTTDCLSRIPSDRPKRISQLLSTLERYWTPATWQAARV
jgi:serine/threonine protein kinase